MMLDLVNQQNSKIKYEVIVYPDKQQDIIILEDLKDYEDIDITIQSRLNNFLDLERIICATKAIRGLFYGEKGIRLEVPYFLGSRSDRKFKEGGCNYLKDVICPIINSLNFESIYVLDPHSDVLEACLNRFEKKTNYHFVEWALQNIKDYVIISPDAGANKKIFKLCEQIGYSNEVITCSKNRDENGKLTKTHIPLSNLGNKNLVIIDDICDGGATFINIAKTIKEHYIGESEPKIYLLVTHGIFSKGFKELSYYFDGIYCTNSYSDVTGMNDIMKEYFIFKQQNIF